MTIMTVGNSEGQRRCDGTCRNAKGPKCACCCGGRYHGAGQTAQALMTEDWLGPNWRDQKAAIEAAGFKFEDILVKAFGDKLQSITQLPLDL